MFYLDLINSVDKVNKTFCGHEDRIVSLNGMRRFEVFDEIWHMRDRELRNENNAFKYGMEEFKKGTRSVFDATVHLMLLFTHNSLDCLLFLSDHICEILFESVLHQMLQGSTTQ